MDSPDRLLTVEDLADYLGVPVTTLYQWRYRPEGPPGFRVGRHVRYRWPDVIEWIEHQLQRRQPMSACQPQPVRLELADDDR